MIHSKRPCSHAEEKRREERRKQEQNRKKGFFETFMEKLQELHDDLEKNW